MTRKEPRPLEPLKVGDNVSYYFVDSTNNLAYGSGPIRRIEEGVLNVNGRMLHPKQVRRLKPRKKPEPQEERERVVRYFFPSDHGYQKAWSFKGPSDEGVNQLKLVELREGEIPLSREALEKAAKAFTTNWKSIVNAIFEEKA